MKRKAYLYQRVSSERQKDNSSIFRQTEAQTAWLERHPDVEVADRLVDDGLSGHKGENVLKGSLGKLVVRIENGEIEHGSLILVEHFSRLSRQNIDKTEELLRRIWNGGITIVTVRDGMEFPPSSINDMAQRIRLIVEIEKAYSESKWRSEKVKSSYLKREKEALQGKTPSMRRAFWLNPDGTLNEHHRIIQCIYLHYLNGLGQHRIIDKLKEQFGSEIKPLKRMDPSSIIRILKSEIVLGKWRGMQVYEPAIDEERYYLALQELQLRANREVKPDRDWLLSGLLECGHCNTGMTIQQTKGSAPVLRCSSKKREGGASKCSMRYVFPYFLANAYFLSVISGRVYFYLKNVDLKANERARIAEIQVTLKYLAEEQSALEVHYRELLNQRKPTSTVVLKLTDIEGQIAELSTELAKLKTPRTDFDITKLKGQKLIDEIQKMENYAQNYPKEYKKHFQELGLKLVIKDKHISTKEPDARSDVMVNSSLNLSKLPCIEYREYSRKTMSYVFNLHQHNMSSNNGLELATVVGRNNYNF